MSRVKCLELPGYDLIFIPGDHAPPHFHLSKTDERWEVAVEFLSCTSTHLETRSVRPANWKQNQHPVKGKVLRKFCQDISDNQAILLAEWDKAHEGLE
jgi:hypothetical protein